MLTNGGHLFLNQLGDLRPFPMKFHFNELSMEKILSFAEVANIAGVHINLDTPKGKLINVHIEDGKIFHLKALAQGLFYAKFNEPAMINNPINVSLNAYSYLTTVKQNSDFTDSKIEGAQKV